MYGIREARCLQDMRLVLLALFTTVVFNAVSGARIKEPPTDTVLSNVSGKIIFSKMGFAPIPAFSFESPIAIAFLSVRKNRFSFEPDFALGLNGKPWMGNNWFRFTIFKSEKIKLSTGLNPSLFFKNERNDRGLEIIRVQRNFTAELVTVLNLSPVVSLTATYMNIHAFDHGALSGSFVDLSVTIQVLGVPEVLNVTFRPQVFYFDFDGNTDGFFSSATLTSEFQKIPVSLYYQAVLPVWTDFSGNKFKWNAGVICSF